MDGDKCYVIHDDQKPEILEIFLIGKEIPMLKRIEEMVHEPLNSDNKKLAMILLDKPDTFFADQKGVLKIRAIFQNRIRVSIYSGIISKIE